MCIVIDLNTVSSVFDADCAEHPDFQAVFEWILHGKGKIVRGGTKYFEELSRLRRFQRVFKLLSDAGKIVNVDDSEVDQKEKELRALCSDEDFDDPHIVALLIVSGCRLLCSQDSRSYPYVLRREWYQNKNNIPKIYCARSSRRARTLLCDSNIADVCLPCVRLRKDVAQHIQR